MQGYGNSPIQEEQLQRELKMMNRFLKRIQFQEVDVNLASAD